MAGLLLKESFEVKDRLSGAGFLLEEGDTDVAGVLVNQSKEIVTTRVGSWGDGSH
jgi:hypothetical protein